MLHELPPGPQPQSLVEPPGRALPAASAGQQIHPGRSGYIGLDDTLERRWGAKIKARGIYRDPVRSSHGHFVKASGLRWLSVLLLPEIAWAGRVWGLPFLTALAPSERYATERDRPHKKLTDWGRQVLLQAARWLPGRKIIAVADASFAAIDLLNAARRRVCMITRLRLDARLFSIRRPGAVPARSGGRA